MLKVLTLYKGSSRIRLTLPDSVTTVFFMIGCTLSSLMKLACIRNLTWWWLLFIRQISITHTHTCRSHCYTLICTPQKVFHIHMQIHRLSISLYLALSLSTLFVSHTLYTTHTFYIYCRYRSTCQQVHMDACSHTFKNGKVGKYLNELHHFLL